MRFPEGLDLRSHGQQLLAGREAKGWTQKQLSEKLFLPVHFIRALEAGESGMLPELPYVMSMYRKAATAVDVDPEPMIQACKAFQVEGGQLPIHQPQPRPRQAVQRPNPSSDRPWKQHREPIIREARTTSQHTPQREARAGQSKDKGDWLIVLVGCGLGLALVGVALWNSELWLTLRSRLIAADPEAEEAETVAETQNQVPENLATPPQLTTDTPDGQPGSPDGQLEEPEPGTVRFIFTANANDNRSSWIRVENARGVLLFESTPEPATSVDLPTAAGVRVRLGRPALVRWQQPGQPPQALPLPQADGWIELIPTPADGQ
ncbi:MAG: helix-turn-helix domain-containing protein [Synechococcus sp. SB0678_bin_12]|nr:helix-turn-helix domain-containing protein [Synechococcus sp. SB0678_bin_12]MYI87150.1 helix-turn-helix domain-containing protein [Synechococcus sp. SB0672_bin_10]